LQNGGSVRKRWQRHDARPDLGWLDDVPDLIFGCILITLYRLIWVITIVGSRGDGFWSFWCGSYHYSIPFLGMSSLVLELAWCWSAFLLVLRWRQGRSRWAATIVRLFLLVVISGYFVIGFKMFGGVTCMVGPEKFTASMRRPAPYLPVTTRVPPKLDADEFEQHIRPVRPGEK